jgi:hypothetical protein
MTKLKIKGRKKWQRELRAGYAALRKETAQGAEFHMLVVPADRWDALVKAGDRGDLHARQIVYNLNAWFKTADQAAADKTWPACCSCGLELRQGDVCGWVIFMPPEGEERTGMIGVFCEDCLHLGRDAIAENTLDLMREHGEVLSTH